MRGPLSGGFSHDGDRRDGEIAELLDRSLSSRRWTAEHLKGARVVKTFNNIQSAHLMEKSVARRTDRAAGGR